MVLGAQDRLMRPYGIAMLGLDRPMGSARHQIGSPVGGCAAIATVLEPADRDSPLAFLHGF
jgi:hypothetical protein